MIQARGVGIVLVAVSLFVLAGSTRVGWLLLFDAVLWGTVVVSAIMPWLAIGKPTIQRRVVGWEGRRDDPGPMEGEAVMFDITVTNRGLLPSMFFTVRFNCGGPAATAQRDRLFVAWLGRGRRLSASTKVTFHRRGPHQLDPVSVETSVPFGLFRRVTRMREHTRLLVLPRVYPMKRAATLGTVDRTVPRPIATQLGDEIVGSRRYLPGDPWKHLHWRNTARRAEPQVKEFEQDTGDSLVIAFVPTRIRQEGVEALEHAVRIAASVGGFVCRLGGNVTLRVGGREEAFTARTPLLERLAVLGDEGEFDLDTVVQSLPYPSNVLVIVPETDAQIVEPLDLAESRHHHLSVVTLRGFNRLRSPTRPKHGQHPLATPAVDCWPGDIPGTLEALERTLY